MPLITPTINEAPRSAVPHGQDGFCRSWTIARTRITRSQRPQKAGYPRHFRALAGNGTGLSLHAL